ncbi:acyl-CoA dehydrogenase family protein [Variovorax paradoxus]|nr:acyl-CoA dehydrogenase family protein [Variovorax paradoxus]MBT2301900.1 acyl-CoA dehydrogenase family protein [Variovorax paradoxus]
MSDFGAQSQLRTHAVENQAPPLEGVNAFVGDTALRESLVREGGEWAVDRLTALGDVVNDPEHVEQAFLANKHTPELRRFDRYGQRVDVIEFHPSYHHLMKLAYQHDVGAMPWNNPRPGAHVAKAAASILFNQLEGGVMCPYAITYGVIPLVRLQPELAAIWEKGLLSRAYDPRSRLATDKTGLTAAFSSTEKQGGSDVRSNKTFARPAGRRGPGEEYLISGHKWFCSAAAGDVFFIVAQTEKGPSCFLAPKWLPDGSRNPISLERLKDKLGNKSNASCEIELENARGWLIGEEGRGIPVMMAFIHCTRFETVLAPAGFMRKGLSEAMHHASHRQAFGKRLVDQPLMRNVLADLALESEAATAFAMRIGRSFDRKEQDPVERAYARTAIAIGKYWLNKRVVPFLHEAMEVFGGPGYVEDCVMPRLYREAPVHGLWEGPGNVQALDVLRTLGKEADACDALFGEMRQARGGNRLLDGLASELRDMISSGPVAPEHARYLTEKLAIALQASLLVQHAPAFVSDAFCATRIGQAGGSTWGALKRDVDTAAILERATVR